jgi:hypothetical protein
MSLPVSQKLALLCLILKTVGKLCATTATAPFRGRAGHPSTFRHVFIAAVRTYLSGLQIPQERYLSASTDDAYLELAKSKGLKAESVVLDGEGHGAKGHWIGNRSAETVILYAHGILALRHLSA